MLRLILHYGIHFIVPFLIAYLFYQHKFWKISGFLLLGIVIDLDHLLATPIFDAGRCSINYHPLHSYPAIMLYLILFSFKPTRIIGLALLIHILADVVDCLFIW
jgi:hypothetical protein